MALSSIYRKRGRGRGGSVLALVLIVMSTMVILSAGLAYRTRVEMRLVHANAQRTQAYYLALGGIERIKALLSREELTPLTIARICQFTSTATEEELFGQFKDFAPDDGQWVTYSLRDELACLSVNNSDPASWTNIDCVSRELRSSISDWMDEDDDISPEGAETDFYERLEFPYTSKNGVFIALKELLFLKGVTPEIYLGEDLNRNSLLDENEKDGQLRIPPDNEDNLLDLGLVDVFTVYGDGRLNINTVSKPILAALPGLDEGVAELILAQRAGPDGALGTEDDACIASAKDIADVEGLTELQIELLGHYCVFDSEYFRIFSCAQLNGTFKCCLMATVRFTDSGPQILLLERLL